MSQKTLRSSRRGSNHIGSNVRTRRMSPAPLPKKEKKEEEGDVAMLPMAGAAFIATCIGGPAILVVGLKLGMFAAIGGGIMGYTTGKMFADHE